MPKEIGLLHELLPKAARFGVVVTRANAWVDRVTKDAQSAAATIGRKWISFLPMPIREIDAAFTELVQKRVEAFLVADDVILTGRQTQILTLAARHALPAIYSDRTWPDAGGLLSLPSEYRSNATEQGPTGTPTGTPTQGAPTTGNATPNGSSGSTGR